MGARLNKAERWMMRLQDAGCFTTLKQKRQFLATAPRSNIDTETAAEIAYLRSEIMIIECYLHAERMCHANAT